MRSRTGPTRFATGWRSRRVGGVDGLEELSPPGDPHPRFVFFLAGSVLRWGETKGTSGAGPEVPLVRRQSGCEMQTTGRMSSEGNRAGSVRLFVLAAAVAGGYLLCRFSAARSCASCASLAIRICLPS